MKTVIGGLLLCFSLSAAAQTNEAAKKARALSSEAAKERDPQKKQEYRRLACEAWASAAQQSPKADYHLELGRCRREEGDDEGAEREFRAFLFDAPQAHPARALVSSWVEEFERKRQQEILLKLEPRLVVSGPLVVEDSPAQRLRKQRVFVWGGLGLGGALLGGVVWGLVQSQDPQIRLVTEER